MKDLMEVHAREMSHLPDGYEMCGWCIVEPFDNSPGISVRFGLTNGVFERGPRKGQRRFHKASARHEITVFVAKLAHLNWLRDWEVNTGDCHVCQGSGQEFAGWSCDEGTKYRPCQRCNATGKAP